MCCYCCENSLHDMENLKPSGRPVPMRDFLGTVQGWLSQETDSGLPHVLTKQFQEIKHLSPQHDHHAAQLDENRGKNRYSNILPFDHSRVKLSIINNKQSSDFINANYIPGYYSKDEYIATQGPLEWTVNDFWRMVWEQQVPAIIMLSGFAEGGASKVYPYFPVDNTMNQSQKYGAIIITLRELVKSNNYTRRSFEIAVDHVTRRVYHFYLEGWHDFGANLSVLPVLSFIKTVREYVPPRSKHPILIHCSAGVGRTGTFIAIDYFIQYVREKSLSEPIDIFQFVLMMREYRTTMVQACEQYVFLHKAVAELVRRKLTPDDNDEPLNTYRLDKPSDGASCSGSTKNTNQSCENSFYPSLTINNQPAKASSRLPGNRQPASQSTL